MDTVPTAGGSSQPRGSRSEPGPAGAVVAQWQLRPRLVAVLVAAAVVLTALGLAVQLYVHFVSIDFPGADSAIRLLDPDMEQSIPTWFNSVILAVAAVLFAFLAATDPADLRRGWTAASIAAVGLSLDEVAGLHERLGFAMRAIFDVSLFLWVVPGALIVIAAAVVAVPFLRRLDRNDRTMLVVGAGIYVLGVLVLEGLSGIPATSDGKDDLTYGLVTVGEEAMEWAGALLVVNALVVRLRRSERAVVLRLGEAASGPSSAAG